MTCARKPGALLSGLNLPNLLVSFFKAQAFYVYLSTAFSPYAESACMKLGGRIDSQHIRGVKYKPRIRGNFDLHRVP